MVKRPSNRKMTIKYQMNSDFSAPAGYGGIHKRAKAIQSGRVNPATYGIRLHHLVLVVSEIWPNKGSFMAFQIP
jgi:hypothetical protein